MYYTIDYVYTMYDGEQMIQISLDVVKPFNWLTTSTFGLLIFLTSDQKSRALCNNALPNERFTAEFLSLFNLLTKEW